MKAIGICNRTETEVFETEVNGYSAYCPELDEDLYDFEWTKFNKMKYIIVENLDDHTKYNGQEVEIINELEDDYFEVTDGTYNWIVSVEEIVESKK